MNNIVDKQVNPNLCKNKKANRLDRNQNPLTCCLRHFKYTEFFIKIKKVGINLLPMK